MPFSSRQGFLDSGTFTPPGANMPAYPGVPVYTQYINYLSNCSANSATTLESNITTPKFGGIGDITVTHENGNVYMFPRKDDDNNSDRTRFIGEIEPNGKTFRLFSPTYPASFSSEDFKSQDVLLGSDGNLYGGVQGTAEKHWKYDPVANVLTVVGSIPVNYAVGVFVRLPNNDHLLVPGRNNTKYRRTIENSGTYNQVGNVVVSGAPFGSQNIRNGVLAPNGMVYSAGTGYLDVIKYNPITNETITLHTFTESNIGSIALNNKTAFTCGSIDNTGNVVFGPHQANNYCKIDTTTDTVSFDRYGLPADYFDLSDNIRLSFGTPLVDGCVFMPNGNILFTPGSSFDTINNTDYPGNIVEISGSAGTSRIVSSITPAFTKGASVGVDGNVYVPIGDNRFPVAPNPAVDTTFGNTTIVINPNANTSVNSANTHFTFQLTPVGQSCG